METHSQESDIINKSDLEHIMADLSRDNQNFCVFLEQEEYIDINEISNSTREIKQELPTMMNDGRDGELDAISYPSSSVSPNTNTKLSTGSMPSINDYPGPFNFELSMGGATYRRGSWVYSTKLNKVFIDVDKVMLIKFKVHRNSPLGLRIRALLVYPAPDHMNRAVSRCTLHKCDLDPNHQAHANPDVCLCQNYKLVGHVLISDHANAIYEYNPESQRHSVVVPVSFPQPDSDSTTVAYQFGCKNSCAGGMSRRAINIIFTLENANGDVFGRRRLSVKVCSCPKRDKEREEIEFNKCKSSVIGCYQKRSNNNDTNNNRDANNKRMRSDCQQCRTCTIKNDMIDALLKSMNHIANQICQLQQTQNILVDQLTSSPHRI